MLSSHTRRGRVEGAAGCAAAELAAELAAGRTAERTLKYMPINFKFSFIHASASKI